MESHARNPSGSPNLAKPSKSPGQLDGLPLANVFIHDRLAYTALPGHHSTIPVVQDRGTESHTPDPTLVGPSGNRKTARSSCH
jgi:hypothetical protein